MRALNVLCVTLLVGTSGQAVAQDWIPYANLADRFSINFPGQPTVTETTYLSDYRAIMPARIYSAEQGASRYSLTVVDYTETERLHQERSARVGDRVRGDDLSGEILGSIAFAAWNIRNRGGEVTYDSWAHYDRIPGHQLQITNADESRTFVAIFLNIRYLYILEATVPRGYPPPGLYQQSLNMLDENGARMRFEYYVGDGGEMLKRPVQTSERWSGDPPTLTMLPRDR